METEQWALVISAIALFVSIITPIWHRSESKRQEISRKQILLLQTILSTRSVNNLSVQEARLILNKYHNQMSTKQRQDLEILKISLEKNENELSKLHSYYASLQ